ncbi:MAG: LuxR C-terminal-related transcriptional regulator, partial [Chitinophagaceae bacterium]
IFRNHLFTEALYWNTEQNRVDPAAKIELDEREKQIIRLLWQEKTNKEIAEEIFLSIRSIEKIRQNLKARLSVRSTVGIFKYAIRTGIIPDA